jgi:hypothetical protein
MLAQQLFVKYYAKFHENPTYCLAVNTRSRTDNRCGHHIRSSFLLFKCFKMTNTKVFKLLFVYYFVGLSGNVYLSFLGLVKFLTGLMLSHNCHFPAFITLLLRPLHKRQRFNHIYLGPTNNYAVGGNNTIT